MRPFMLTALVATISWLSLPAQIISNPEKQVEQVRGTQLSQKLERIEQERTRAILGGDIEVLKTVVSPAFTVVDPTGRVITKTDLLAGLQSGKIRYYSLELTDIQVEVFGSSAVLTGYYMVSGEYDGRDISGRYRIKRLFSDRGGVWQGVFQRDSFTGNVKEAANQ